MSQHGCSLKSSKQNKERQTAMKSKTAKKWEETLSHTHKIYSHVPEKNLSQIYKNSPDTYLSVRALPWCSYLSSLLLYLPPSTDHYTPITLAFLLHLQHTTSPTPQGLCTYCSCARNIIPAYLPNGGFFSFFQSQSNVHLSENWWHLTIIWNYLLCSLILKCFLYLCIFRSKQLD